MICMRDVAHGFPMPQPSGCRTPVHGAQFRYGMYKRRGKGGERNTSNNYNNNNLKNSININIYTFPVRRLRVYFNKGGKESESEKGRRNRGGEREGVEKFMK
jgi:hypothetical protein